MKKITAILTFSALILICLLAFPGDGQTQGNPENWCRNGLFPRQNADFKTAKIKGRAGDKIYFYGDAESNCPASENCRLKSYLVPDDEVIVAGNYGKFACAWHQPAKGGETVGWIELGKLEILEANKNSTLADWPGRWKFYDNTIEIAKSKTAETLDVAGSAFWKGLGDNIHIGEMNETSVRPGGNTLKIGENETDEFDCRVAMRLVGSFLIVSDNLRCGGANVSFSGVYRKQ